MIFSAPTITAFLIGIVCLCSLIISVWTGLKVREIYLMMNSRLDQLLDSSIGQAHAAGIEHERAREGRRIEAEAREAERKRMEVIPAMEVL